MAGGTRLRRRPDADLALKGRAPVQLVAALAGIAFVFVGLGGFVPGLTTHYGELAFAGRGSRARLMGEFPVSVLQNLVHLALGGILLLGTAARSRAVLTGGGIASLALWSAGAAGALDWLPVDAPGNWLHLTLGLTLLALLALTSREDLGDDLERDLGR